MIRRNSKQGYVYLFKSINSDEYKFGCSKIYPTERLKQANKRFKDITFQISALFKSNDIYADENIFKWFVVDNFPFTGEFFGDIDSVGFDCISDKFLSIAGIRL